MAEERSPHPEYPTLMEQGINAINRFDYTVFAPAGLPEDVKKILADFRKALSDPKCIEELVSSGLEPAYLEFAETMELLKKDFRVFNELAEKFNLTS